MALQPRQAGKKLPTRAFVYGPPGAGKTTFSAFTRNPSFIITPRETGIDTLTDNGLAPACSVWEVATWDDYLSTLELMIRDFKEGQTLNIDTANGLQTLCFDNVRRNHFGGDQSKFDAYGKGPDVAAGVWEKQFLFLDRLREKGVMIVMLAHSTIKRAKNPGGEEYDHHAPQLHEKLSLVVDAWADQTLFIHRKPITLKEGMKHKNIGQELQIVCNSQPFCKAKNRSGLPDFIDIPDDKPSSVFGAWRNAMIEVAKKNKEANKTPEQTTAA